MKAYRLMIYNYDCQSDPEKEIFCKIKDENLKYLERLAEDYWINHYGYSREEIEEKFEWENNSCSIFWKSFNDGDCKYSIIDIIEISDNADGSSALLQKTE